MVLKYYKTSTKPPPVLQYLIVSVVLKDLHLYYTYRFKFGAGFIIKRALSTLAELVVLKSYKTSTCTYTDSSSEWGSL